MTKIAEKIARRVHTIPLSKGSLCNSHHYSPCSVETIATEELAPTLALMARLDKCVELAIELHDKQCEICSSEFPCGYSLALSSALTDYEAYLKEQG